MRLEYLMTFLGGFQLILRYKAMYFVWNQLMTYSELPVFSPPSYFPTFSLQSHSIGGRLPQFSPCVGGSPNPPHRKNDASLLVASR